MAMAPQPFAVVAAAAPSEAPAALSSRGAVARLGGAACGVRASARAPAAAATTTPVVAAGSAAVGVAAAAAWGGRQRRRQPLAALSGGPRLASVALAASGAPAGGGSTASGMALSGGPPVAEDAGMLLLEHLNLNVLSTEVALAFYEAMGCLRDARRPMDKTLHCNCGALTQFHTPSPENEAYIGSSGAQVWRGDIELLYQDYASIAEAGRRLRLLLQDSRFEGSRLRVEEDSNSAGCLWVVGPYGNRFSLRPAAPERAAGLGPAFGERPGSAGCRVVGMGSASLQVPVGAGEAGARFYAEVLGFATRQLGPGRWAVVGGPGNVQELVLEEHEGADGKDLGEHVAIYIGDYAGCFERLLARGLVWVNPRFEHLDKSTNLKEAWHYNCFRFKDVVDPASGRKLFELEHEVRSTGHKSCPLAL